MTVRELVIDEMRKRGWNNAELARRSGLSATTIGQIVNDRVPHTRAGKRIHWTTDTLTKLAEAFTLPVSRFRDAAGFKTEEPSISAQANELLVYFNSLSEAQRRDVCLMIRALALHSAEQDLPDTGQDDPDAAIPYQPYAEPHGVRI